MDTGYDRWTPAASYHPQAPRFVQGQIRLNACTQTSTSDYHLQQALHVLVMTCDEEIFKVFEAKNRQGVKLTGPGVKYV